MKLVDLIGKEVLNVWRQDFDLPQEYRDSYKGTVVSVEEDRLPLIGVDCGVEFIRYMPIQDLAFADTWPKGDDHGRVLAQLEDYD